MKKLIFAVLFLIGSTAFANSQVTELAKCQHHNGYGSFVGFGETKADARKQATTKCFNTLVDRFERSKSRLPTSDEAELILTEQCLNICS